MNQTKVEVLETLRDCMQQKGMETTVPKALELVRQMDELAFAYVELGFIGANDFANELISKAAEMQEELKNLKLAAFGRTRRPDEKVEKSRDVNLLVQSGLPVAVVVAKSRLMDVELSLGTDGQTNLQMIFDTVKYLKDAGVEVVVDLEHAVDAFYGRGCFGKYMTHEDADSSCFYLFNVADAAIDAGADCLVICDTNGGASPEEIYHMFRRLKQKFPSVKFGIHCHNDNEMAVANTRAAVQGGAKHIQGVTNGYGERCGNTNLISSICRLQLKDGIEILPEESLIKITEYARKFATAFNKRFNESQAWVGQLAFYTSAGMHASSEGKAEGSYLQARPETAGNKARIGVSSHSGISNLILTAEEFGIQLTKKEAKKLISDYPHMIENEGFEISSVSFNVAYLRSKNECPDFFHTLEYKALTKKDFSSEKRVGQGIVRMEVAGKVEYIIDEGAGAVDGLFNAVKKALRPYFCEVDDVQLTLYDVHGLGVSDHGSGALVRVTAQFENGDSPWVTVGVSHDQTDAALRAFVDALRWYLYKKRILKK